MHCLHFNSDKSICSNIISAYTIQKNVTVSDNATGHNIKKETNAKLTNVT